MRNTLCNLYDKEWITEKELATTKISECKQNGGLFVTVNKQNKFIVIFFSQQSYITGKTRLVDLSQIISISFGKSFCHLYVEDQIIKQQSTNSILKINKKDSHSLTQKAPGGCHIGAGSLMRDFVKKDIGRAGQILNPRPLTSVPGH